MTGKDMMKAKKPTFSKYKGGSSIEKGKKAYVRNSNRMIAHSPILNGKLVLEKRKGVRCKVDSESSSSNFDIEEGQIRNFSLTKGECSKAKYVGKGPKLDESKFSSGSLASKMSGSQESSKDGSFVPNTMSKST